MRRLLRSLILGAGIGALMGLALGFFAFPQSSYRSALSELAQAHRDDYTVMIAAGYAADADLSGAQERLTLLGVADTAAYVAEVTERVIGTGARDIRDIHLLVKLAKAFGRLSPAMQPFLDVGG